MAKSSYKSSAQKQAEAVALPGERVPPPKELEPPAAALWLEIVSRLPADWITSETKPLLTGYCRHAMYAQRFAEDIEAQRTALARLETGGRRDKGALKALELMTGKLHELHRMHGYETDRMVTLATKMRFTQQSKYFPDKAAVRSRQSAPTGPKPWQDWGENSTEH